MVETLYNAINEELHLYVTTSEKLGWDDPRVEKLRNRILGMQDVFEIFTGQSYVDYLKSKFAS